MTKEQFNKLSARNKNDFLRNLSQAAGSKKGKE